MKKQIKKGFTLIELLIVVAIIGILAVALVPTITDAPARARDAARRAATNNVITALESYNIDNGSYPDGNFCIDGDVTDSDANNEGSLVTDYLGDKAPSQSEPGASSIICGDGSNAYVLYEGGGSSYQIMIQLENGTDQYANPGSLALDGNETSIAAAEAAGLVPVFAVTR